VRQQEFNAATKRIEDDFVAGLKRDQELREAEALRTQALHKLVDSIFFVLLAIGSATWMVVKLRRRKTVVHLEKNRN
jgi:hypothetical protein